MKTRRATKQDVIDALFDALVRVSVQTKDYDPMSTMGCLHDIARKAVEANMQHTSRAKLLAPAQ